MHPRKPTVEAFVDVVKLLVHAPGPLTALEVVAQAGVAEPSVRRYLAMLEARGLIEPAYPTERQGQRGRPWQWVR